MEVTADEAARLVDALRYVHELRHLSLLFAGGLKTWLLMSLHSVEVAT